MTKRVVDAHDERRRNSTTTQQEEMRVESGGLSSSGLVYAKNAHIYKKISFDPANLTQQRLFSVSPRAFPIISGSSFPFNFP